MKRITTLLIAVLAIAGLLPGALPAYALSFSPPETEETIHCAPATARGCAGGLKSETIIGTLGKDTIDAGGGEDYVLGKRGGDYIEGAEGADMLVGGFGNNVLMGGAGYDYLEGRNGSDVFWGGRTKTTCSPAAGTTLFTSEGTRRTTTPSVDQVGIRSTLAPPERMISSGARSS